MRKAFDAMTLSFVQDLYAAEIGKPKYAQLRKENLVKFGYSRPTN